MKSWTIAAVLLPAVAFAFPQMNGRRYVNETSNATSTIKYTTASPTLPPPVNTVPPYTRTSVVSPTGVPTAPPTAACLPGKYQCTYSATSGWGWAVCDASANWVPAGSCAASETCTFNPLNGSPYCVPSAPAKPQDESKECYPDKYQCAYSPAKGWYINQCDASGHWKSVVDCKATETCTYGAVHGYPYCKAKEDARVCTPGAYECHYDNAKSSWGWRACSAEGAWVQAGYCSSGQTCSFNPLNGSPYCL